MALFLIGAGLLIVGLVTAINTLNLMVIDAEMEDIRERLDKWN